MEYTKLETLNYEQLRAELAVSEHQADALRIEALTSDEASDTLGQLQWRVELIRSLMSNSIS